MRNKRIISIFLLAIIISVMLTVIYYFGIVLIEVEEFDMDILIGDNVGFNTNTDALHFGTVYAGGRSTRSINVHNQNDFPIEVVIKMEGEVSDWILIANNNIILEPGSNTSIKFTADTPADVKKGAYQGKAKILIKRNAI